MLELKIEPKDPRQDCFEIMTWKQDDLTMILQLRKSEKQNENGRKSSQRILVGSESAILARLREEESPAQTRERKTYSIPALTKEFFRQFTFAGKGVFKSRTYAKLAEDIRQTQGYDIGIIYDVTTATHSFLTLFSTGYSDYMHALKLFEAAIRGRDKFPVDLCGEEPLRAYLRDLYNNDSPAAKYMSLQLWVWYRRCAEELDKELREELVKDVVERYTRLAGAFWDSVDVISPQGNELLPDDPVLGGEIPEDRREWELLRKESVAFSGTTLFLNGSFQALKHQYMTSVNAYHCHFRKCARCNKNWFFTEVGREVFCKGCKEPRKEEKDRDNSKRNRETPGYEQKLKALKQAKEWAEWVEKHSTKEAAADFREKLEQMEALWKPYQKNYEEEDDPEKKEALKTEFLRELRKRSRELEERYDDLCRLAEIQPDQR